MNHALLINSEPLASRPGSSTVAVAAGWILLIAFVAVCACLGDLSRHVRLFQAGYVVGFAGFGLLVHAVWRRRPPGSWKLWLAGCLLLRLALLHVEPSDDLYRYLWEGRVQVAGYNPFVATPDDPSLSALRDANWSHINHRDYPAIYPPLAQMQFRAIATVLPTLFGVKLFYVAFDALAVVLLAAWLRREGRSPYLAFVYGLCPLTLTAVGMEGHLDSAMIAMLAAAGLADAHRRPYLCAACVAAAVLTKILPVLLLPWLARRNARAAIFAVALVVLGYLPYVEPGAQVFHSLIRVPRTTEMLSLGHGAMLNVAGADASRALCALIVVSVALWHARRSSPLSRVMLPIFGAMIIFMPIVHFWYLTWILLALPFAPRVCWLVLTASMVFYFEAMLQQTLTETWSMPTWVPYPVYAPFVMAWIVELVAARRRRLTG